MIQPIIEEIIEQDGCDEKKLLEQIQLLLVGERSSRSDQGRTAVVDASRPHNLSLQYQSGWKSLEDHMDDDMACRLYFSLSKIARFSKAYWSPSDGVTKGGSFYDAEEFYALKKSPKEIDNIFTTEYVFRKKETSSRIAIVQELDYDDNTRFSIYGPIHDFITFSIRYA